MSVGKIPTQPKNVPAKLQPEKKNVGKLQTICVGKVPALQEIMSANFKPSVSARFQPLMSAKLSVLS